jgi:hypothetical protein
VPGSETSVTVRVEPAADLTGASFELPEAQDGVSSRFEAAADGATGILTLEASSAVAADDRALTVHGTSGSGANTWVGALTVRTAASATATTIFVNPTTGSDAADGAQSRPFKTLGKALAVAQAGDTVKLAAGSYTKAVNGEQYPLTVPNGVTIVGTLKSNGAKDSVLSPVSSATQETGLLFAGDATVKDLELDVFGTALFADKGKLTLNNLNFILNVTSLRLRGTARTTLAKSLFFINAQSGVTAVSVDGQVTFTMDGGTIETTGQNCETGVKGIAANQSAQVTLKNGVKIEGIAGSSLDLQGSSKGTLQSSNIDRFLPDGCHPAPAVHFSGASLAISGGSIGSAGGTQSFSISTISSGTVTLNDTFLQGDSVSNTSIGIRLGQDTKLTITNSDISFFGTGIDARFNTSSVTIMGTNFSFNRQLAIFTTSGLKLRNSTFNVNRRSIAFFGTNVSGDLGTSADPGGNTIIHGGTDPSIIGVDLGSATSGLVSAVGNTWTAATQGSNINGNYPSKLEVGPTADQFKNKKRNFFLPNANTKIQL